MRVSRALLGSLKQKEHSLSANLLPGRWNPIQVTIPNIDPKSFGYLSVSIDTDEILLY